MKHRNTLTGVILAALLLAPLAVLHATSLTNIRCEYRTDPLGIDTPKPRLSWINESTDRGARQTAYQILVATTPGLLSEGKGDLWDSGKVLSDRQTQIEYSGKPLASRQECYWKVCAWDATDKSYWSQPAKWTMGLLKPEDWSAKWIGIDKGIANPMNLLGSAQWIWFPEGDPATSAPVGVRYFRRNFTLPAERKLVKATVQLTADNSCELYVNGKNAGHGDNFKVPVTINITRMLQGGSNTLAVAATNGGESPNPAGLIAALKVEFAEGVPLLICSDGQWQANPLKAEGWEQVGFDDARWVPAKALGKNGMSPWGNVDTEDACSLLLRREFVVKPGLRHATVFITGLGQYEFSLNGKKVGEDLLSPGWTDYAKTVLYDTFDITHMLREGTNSAGIFLGNGFADVRNVMPGRFCWHARNGPPQQALIRICLDYADGASEAVISDEKWRVGAGPITFSNIYGGEDYDARQEQAGWDQAGFNDAPWVPAKVLPGPGGVLKGLSCAAEPVRAFETLRPVASKEISRGTVVYDLGQNASLMLRIKVSGQAGASVKITPAELLDPEGRAHRGIFQGQQVYWLYTLAGRSEETYFSKFFYVGARYLQVEFSPAPGTNKMPELKSIEGVVVHGDAPAVGDFSCSNDLFSRIYKLVRWAQMNNMVSVLTDCPTREKMGYLEEDYLNGPALRYNFDLSTLLIKTVIDAAVSQAENGSMPLMAPDYAPFGESTEWGSALILIAWQQYEFTGDTEILKRHYNPMKRYMDHLGTQYNEQHINTSGFGDWRELDGKRTPNELTGMATYYRNAVTLAKIAGLLHKDADAEQYGKLAGEIRELFNRKFFNPDTAQYSVGAQSSNAFPLALDMVPDGKRQAVLDNIVKDIQAKGLTSGEVGFGYLLRALAEGGRSDIIFAMNNQTNRPGYGNQLANGATSLTEDWDFQPNNSQNHFMLGQINEWFFHDVAGIQHDPAAPGFKKIIIKPAIVGDLTWVKCHYDSNHGRIISNWKREGDNLTMDVTIPANTTATVYVPAKDAAAVTESDKPAAKSGGVKFLRMEKRAAVYEVGSGNYRFESNLPRIVINKAMYGDLAGKDPGRILDLTKELQGQVDRGENVFTVSSLVHFKGDPASGFIKTLMVEFHLGGKAMRKSATDPETIDLLDAVGQ